MPIRKIKFEEGRYYHVFNRGADRSRIFFQSDHYLFLLERIKKYFIRDHQVMIVYCLMPNHYHFLVRQNGSVELSKTMQAIFNSYSKAINHQLGRTGTLFEGRFKCNQINDESYLIHLCRYIHRNPIDTNPPLVKRIEDWPYSNYREWIGQRDGNLIDREFVHYHFTISTDYAAFVMEQPAAKVLKRLEKISI